MVLISLATLILAQGKPLDPVETLKAALPSWKVEGVREGSTYHISIKHRIQIGGGGQSGQVASTTPVSELPSVTVTEQLLGVPETAKGSVSPKWLPPQEYLETMDVDMGSAEGVRWYGHATFEVLRLAYKSLQVKGGESLTAVAIRALRTNQYSNSGAATEYLREQKDAVVGPLKGAAPSVPSAVDILSSIRTPKAVDALVDLYSRPELKEHIELSLAYGNPVEAARPIYEGGLKNQDAAAYCARTATRFGWTELQPEVQSAYDSAKSLFPKLELLNSLHRFKTGSDLPSFEKVHDYFSKWTPHDSRAVLAASEKIYAPLCVAKMISMNSKAGNPHVKDAMDLADMLISSGRGADLKVVLDQYGLTQRMEAIRKEAAGNKG